MYMILILTPFKIEKVHGKFIFQHVSVALGQSSSNGQNYAVVCPNLTDLWHHLQTALFRVRLSRRETTTQG